MTTTLAILNPATHVYSDIEGKRLPFSVSRVLELSGISPQYPQTAAMEYAKDLGWAVHDWCTWLDTDGVEEDDIEAIAGSELVGYVLAYQKFRKDYSPEWERMECSFYREDCGGTPDRIGTILIKGKRTPVIVDLKTPVRAATHWQMQLSAYQWLSELDSSELYSLQLGKDSMYKLTRFSADRETWLAALRIARWKEGLGG